MGVSGGGSSAIWSATTSNMIFKAKADSRYINAIQRNFPEERKSPSYFLATTGTGKLSDVLKRIRGGGRVMLSYKIPVCIHRRQPSAP